MENIKEKLKEDLKIAIKQGNSLKKDVVRMILSESAYEEGKGRILDNDGVIAIIKRMKKNQNEMLESSKTLNISTEIIEAEIAILDSYLPKQMDLEEIKVKVGELIIETAATSMRDMGKIMSSFNAKYTGLADNKIVSEVIKSKLNA